MCPDCLGVDRVRATVTISVTYDSNINFNNTLLLPSAIMQMIPAKELAVSYPLKGELSLSAQSSPAEYCMVDYSFGLMRMSVSSAFDGALMELFKLNRLLRFKDSNATLIYTVAYTS